MSVIQKTVFVFCLVMGGSLPLMAQNADMSSKQIIDRMVGTPASAAPESHQSDDAVRIIIVDGEPQLRLPPNTPRRSVKTQTHTMTTFKAERPHVIEFNGQTIVKIAPDGAIEIINNGTAAITVDGTSTQIKRDSLPTN